MNVKARYIVDADGKPVEVILPIATFRKLVAAGSKGDPDLGRPLKKSFADTLLGEEKNYSTGKRGKPWAQVKRELGLV